MITPFLRSSAEISRSMFFFSEINTSTWINCLTSVIWLKDVPKILSFKEAAIVVAYLEYRGWGFLWLHRSYCGAGSGIWIRDVFSLWSCWQTVPGWSKLAFSSSFFRYICTDLDRMLTAQLSKLTWQVWLSIPTRLKGPNQPWPSL